MKIGIFGGSFNPPHNMHEQIAEELIEKHYVDRIIFVPTGNQYEYKNNLLPDKTRYELVKCLIKNHQNFIVSDYEMKQKVVYTYETLDYFQKEFPKDQIYFICGADNLSYVDKWKNAEYLLKTYPFLVIKRETDSIEEIMSKLKKYQKTVILTKIKPQDISSTEIREYLKNGNVEKAKKYLKKEVLDYIQKNHLYLEEDSMKKVVELLTKKGQTISTMESCTGGGIVNAITSIEGASEVLKYSAITYSNEFKIKMGVNKKIIEKYSVYSMETADEMSKTIAEYTESNYGIGVTGKLNKPDPNNPYGEDNGVFISIYDRINKVFINSKLEVTKSTRKETKEQIIREVERLLLQILQ